MNLICFSEGMDGVQTSLFIYGSTYISVLINSTLERRCCSESRTKTRDFGKPRTTEDAIFQKSEAAIKQSSSSIQLRISQLSAHWISSAEGQPSARGHEHRPPSHGVGSAIPSRRLRGAGPRLLVAAATHRPHPAGHSRPRQQIRPSQPGHVPRHGRCRRTRATS